MKLNELLKQFSENKTISPEQFSALSEISENRRFSLHYELQYLLYFGVLTIIFGIGLTVKKYFLQIGHVTIIGTLTALFAGSFWYCFSKGEKYSNEKVPVTSLILDYVLFFGCLAYSSDIAYIETHFKVLGDFWKNYMLFSFVLFLFLAYKFDNRMILSMALSTLAAWFGFKFLDFNMKFYDYHRIYALIYGFFVLFAGICLDRLKIKKHFFDIYLNFALNFIFVACVSGVIKYKMFSWFFLLLLIMCVLTAVYSLRKDTFLYFVYSVLYGYAGVSAIIIDYVERSRSEGFLHYYFIFSSVGVLVALLVLLKKFKRVE